ncbi:response regulator transcription factor [Lutimonas halocynthiae]|nr:response regulator transcription factor [Lutimonas halocynthiae]MDN3643052.1 response regulator transcription factor [Lutimonas halocynthiae]
MNCIIIEDQAPAQRILKRYIEDVGSLNLINTFSDPIEAMSFLKSNSVDVIFLDIHLPKLSGIDFLKAISNPPKVILTTAFPDYALESYDLDVVDYLLKPFSFQRFVKAVSKLSLSDQGVEKANESNATNSKSLFLKSGHEYIKIDIDQISHINSDADYTDVYYAEKKFISSESLKYWEDALSEYEFIRVHKSYIVNLKMVEKIAKNQIYLLTNAIVPIGRTYKKILDERYLSQK